MSAAKRSQNNDAGSLKLWQEHEQVRNIVQKALDSKDFKEQKTLFNKFVEELCKHSVAEEIAVHPMLIKLGNDEKNKGKSSNVEGWLEKAVEQEHDMARTLHEMVTDLEKKDQQWFTKSLQDAQKSLLEHMQHEEKNIFPFIESNLSKKEVDDLNGLFEKAKSMVPGEPDPKGPLAAINKLLKETEGKDKKGELTETLEESRDIIGKAVKQTDAQGQGQQQQQAPQQAQAAQSTEKGKAEHEQNDDKMEVAEQKGTKREREETTQESNKAAKKEELDSPRKVAEGAK